MIFKRPHREVETTAPQVREGQASSPARSDARIALDIDESLVLLRLMGAPGLNGLPDDIVDDLLAIDLVEKGLGEGERSSRLGAGREKLIRRGLLEMDQDAHALDDTLVALVGSCSLPEPSLLVAPKRPHGVNEAHYFNALPQLPIVHHDLSDHDSHTFDGRASQQQVVPAATISISSRDFLPRSADASTSVTLGSLSRPSTNSRAAASGQPLAVRMSNARSGSCSSTAVRTSANCRSLSSRLDAAKADDAGK